MIKLVADNDPVNRNIPPEFSISTAQKVVLWIRNTFIFFKSLAFIYKSIWTSRKYKATYMQLNIFEIWFMALAGVKILVLLPNIYYKEINWLYACFVLNSFLSYWLSCNFHIRSCVALQKPLSTVRKYRAWFGFKVFFLIAMYLLSPLFVLRASKRSGFWNDKSLKDYPFLMDCTSLVYRKCVIGFYF